MTSRYAQIVFIVPALALCLVSTATEGQEIKHRDVGQSRARQDVEDQSAKLRQSGEEHRQANESDSASGSTAGSFIVRWSGNDQSLQSSPIAAREAAQSGLSFDQTVQLAIKNNLTTLLARERRNEARGLELESLAGLLPNLDGVASQTNQTVNLAAQGLTPQTFPLIQSPLIGPFNSFDARVRLVQTIFNISAIRQYQGGLAQAAIAAISERLARQQVIAIAALAYLNTLRSERAVEAAEANVELARTLLKLANDQHNTGVATGLDVTRSETRVASEQFRLAQAQTDAHQARLQLQRVAGLPLGGRLILTDRLAYTGEPLPSAEQAVQVARQQRVEISLAEQQVRFNDYQRRAAEAEQYPSVDFFGDYGASGTRPEVLDLPTRSIGIRLNVPIFNSGLTRGRVTAATSRQRQAELQLNDLRAQVEQDVRLALETLATAAEQVRAAEQSLKLATRELEMARDRFAAGVGDNIEVAQAQTSLANARDAEVAALTTYNAARINLASAMGLVESFRW
jgi:outer membrane protein TolC